MLSSKEKQRRERLRPAGGMRGPLEDVALELGMGLVMANELVGHSRQGALKEWEGLGMLGNSKQGLGWLELRICVIMGS